MKYKTLFCSALISIWILSAGATSVYKSVYINSGSFTTVDTTYFPYQAFNSTASFRQTNSIIRMGSKDILYLTVHNNDSKKHGFRVKGVTSSLPSINPGDSATYTLNFPAAGAYIYYDDLNYPSNAYLGLAGMICVLDSKVKGEFFWNIKEHEISYNKAIAVSSPVDWTKYYPDYFTINGLSFPDLQNDPSAMVKGAVGDTIRIFVANTGISGHSIHFHGFHTRALASTDPKQIGWEKDTWMMYSMQALILELVPDKKGLYPVHDHNLVSMTGGGHYNQGMMIMIEIK